MTDESRTRIEAMYHRMRDEGRTHEESVNRILWQQRWMRREDKVWLGSLTHTPAGVGSE